MGTCAFNVGGHGAHAPMCEHVVGTTSFHADCRQLLQADGVPGGALHTMDEFLHSCNGAPSPPPDTPPLSTEECTAQFAGLNDVRLGRLSSKAMASNPNSQNVRHQRTMFSMTTLPQTAKSIRNSVS